MPRRRYLIVGAFAERPFTGNPAAVVLLPGPGDEQWMESVAAEFGLSETAFVYRLAQGTWALRWLTPIVEVALCGHATLAAAHALWRLNLEPETGPIRFVTRSGELLADHDDGQIRLGLPSRPIRPAHEPSDLAACLGGVPCRLIGQTLEPDPAARDYLIELPDEAAIQAARPAFSELARCGRGEPVLRPRPGNPGRSGDPSRTLRAIRLLVRAAGPRQLPRPAVVCPYRDTSGAGTRRPTHLIGTAITVMSGVIHAI